MLRRDLGGLMSATELLPWLAPAVALVAVLVTSWIAVSQRKERAADRERAEALRRAERAMPLLDQVVAQLDVLARIEQQLRPGRQDARDLDALGIGPETDELSRRLDRLPDAEGSVGGSLHHPGPIQNARAALVETRSVQAVPDDDVVAAALTGPGGAGRPDPRKQVLLDLAAAGAEQRRVADTMRASITLLREAVSAELEHNQGVIDGLTSR